MTTEEERQRLTREAMAMNLGDLARKVLYHSFTPGVHDTVLFERYKKVEEQNCE